MVLISWRRAYSWKWQRKDKYLNCLKAMCNIFLKETGARIIILDMPTISENFQEKFSSAASFINKVNAESRGLVDLDLDRVTVISLDEVFSDHVREDCVTDGIHFSPLGHRLIFARISEITGGAIGRPGR